MQYLATRLKKYIKDNKVVAEQVMSSTTNVEKAREYAEKMKDIVDKELSALPLNEPIGTSISGPVIEGDTITFEVNIDHGAAMRPSFSKNTGNVDIVRLLNNGWSYTKDPPYGEFKGKRVRAWQKRTGCHFAQNAVTEFNSGAPSNVRAEYDSMYDG